MEEDIMGGHHLPIFKALQFINKLSVKTLNKFRYLSF